MEVPVPALAGMDMSAGGKQTGSTGDGAIAAAASLSIWIDNYP